MDNTIDRSQYPPSLNIKRLMIEISSRIDSEIKPVFEHDYDCYKMEISNNDLIGLKNCFEQMDTRDTVHDGSLFAFKHGGWSFGVSDVGFSVDGKMYLWGEL